MKIEELVALAARILAENDDPDEIRKRFEEEVFLRQREKRYKARLNDAHKNSIPQLGPNDY